MSQNNRRLTSFLFVISLVCNLLMPVKFDALERSYGLSKVDYEKLEVLPFGVRLNWNFSDEIFNSARNAFRNEMFINVREVFTVFRSKSPNELGEVVNSFRTFWGDFSDNRYIDLNVEPNTTYYYTVRPNVTANANIYGEDGELVGLSRYSADIEDEAKWLRFKAEIGPNLEKQKLRDEFILLRIDDPMMSLNGISEEIDHGRGTTPQIINDRTMVPIRSIVEGMDGFVEWEADSRKVSLKLINGLNVKMWIDKYELEINDVHQNISETKMMDVAPIIENGRTYVPVRFATENLGAKVLWLENTREVLIMF